jgi:hypothetical protein
MQYNKLLAIILISSGICFCLSLKCFCDYRNLNRFGINRIQDDDNDNNNNDNDNDTVDETINDDDEIIIAENV